MHLQARRIFRLSAVFAASLALAYALAVPLPFIAPVFAFMLTATPGPPLGPKALFGLVLLREPVRRATWAAIAVASVGVAIMVAEGVRLGHAVGTAIMSVWGVGVKRPDGPVQTVAFGVGALERARNS